MVKVAIAGITGFTGIELLRYLSCHEKVEFVCFISKSRNGEKLSSAGLFVDSSLDRILEPPETELLSEAEVLFSCLPHGESAGFIKTALSKNPSLKVIDLSADFRFTTSELYEEIYKVEHPFKENYPEAVYGLPELNRKKVKQTTIVANPGCYPTAFFLSAFPILKEDLSDQFIYDAKSGISGAGRSPAHTKIYAELEESVYPYSVFTHRHQYEMEHQSANLIGREIKISFMPQVIPASRGILGVLYANLKKKVKYQDLRHIFLKYYSEEPFIHLLKEGDSPKTKMVRGTNNCLLQVYFDSTNNLAAVVSAIDNLGKGASGQAVQNFNLMMGFKEEESLISMPLYP